MRKDVVIRIRGTVQTDGSPEVIELDTAGTFYRRDGSYFISYKESEATGMAGVTTTLRVDGNDCVTLQRSGAQRSSLVLERGRRHLCQYDTGYGDLIVGVSGCTIRSGLGDGGGELRFNYTLDINTDTVSQNEVFVSVKEATPSHVKPQPFRN